ncbi:efflux RND transporter periplasmic adaptor subunit [Thalassospira sp. MA62]|nr:efflux RND transporter periplasmic adaptor subunit [Thalassospira sp. MA62]
MNVSRLIALLLVAGTAVWIGSAYFDGSAEEKAAASDQSDTTASDTPQASVRTITSNATDHIDFLRVSGQTEAVISVEIRAQTRARVAEILAEKGQSVAKGDVIVKLAIDDRAAQVKKARALVEQRELEHNAAESLAEKNYRSRTGVAESLAQLEEARADLIIAQTELAYTDIRAPFDGIVEDRPADIGDMMSVGDPVATMIQADPMLVVAHVPEHSIRSIETGQLAQVTLFDGSQFDGIVRYRARVADNSTRTYRVEVEIDNSTLTIPDGITAQLRIPLGTKRAHHVAPSVLTLNDDGVLGVRGVVDDTKVAFYPVELQGGDNDRVWLGGLPEQFELIVVGHDWVREGASVDVVHLQTDADGNPVMPDDADDADDSAPAAPETTLSEQIAQ